MKDKDILRIFSIGGIDHGDMIECLKIFIDDNEIYSEEVQDLSKWPEDATLSRDLSFFYGLKALFMKGLNIDIDSVIIKEYKICINDDIWDFIYDFDINKYINEEK